jgi:hypothetical protein
VDALVAGSRHWGMQVHFNKGLGGAPPAEVAAASDTAMNPAVLDAFAMAFVIAEGPPAYRDVPGRDADREAEPTAARRDAAAVQRAGEALTALVPKPGSYVSESDFFIRDWAEAFWGSNVPRLTAVKQQYDPDGLFVVHHGVGSDAWDADGFTRLADGGGADDAGAKGAGAEPGAERGARAGP